MIVTRISLTDFRNYRSADVGLVPGANLFVGRNGQGKTNLVEALGYLSTLGSHRVSSDQAMIRQGAESAIVRARLEYEGRTALVEVELNRSSPNRAALNRVPMRPRELPRHVSTLLFAPEDLAIVRGEPSVRRRFLDELLVLRAPRFAGVLADYDRVVRQRNTLLKSARSTGAKELSTLDVWDDKLVALGAELITARADLVRALEPEVVSAYHSVAGTDHTVRLANELSVLSGDIDSGLLEASDEELTLERVTESFRAALRALRPRELDRAVTLAGPHRDDVLIELNSMPARSHASHGESWSLALALKLAAAEVLRRESLLGDPVLVLDDVFAELDESRRERLASAVKGFQQVLITAAVLGDVPDELTGHTVRIENGAIVGAADD